MKPPQNYQEADDERDASIIGNDHDEPIRPFPLVAMAKSVLIVIFCLIVGISYMFSNLHGLREIVDAPLSGDDADQSNLGYWLGGMVNRFKDRQIPVGEENSKMSDVWNSFPFDSRKGTFDGPAEVRTPTLDNNPAGLQSLFLLEKTSVNMFEHPKMVEAIRRSENYEDVMQLCNGPQPNIDVYINEKTVGGKLHGFLGNTVFALDCRGTTKYRLFGVVAVIDMYGNLINMIDWNQVGGAVVESVSMFNTTTVLFATAKGAYHWNFVDDRLERLPFRADAHSLVYRASDNRYYGLYVDEKPDASRDIAHDTTPEYAAAFDPLSGEIVWSFYYENANFDYLSVEGDFAFCSSSQMSSLLKVDMRTNEVVWHLGGEQNHFTIYNADGNPYPEKNLHDGSYVLPWARQHKFQLLGNGFFALFDNNNLPEGMTKPWGKSSRCVILFVDERTMEAWEVFSYITGDTSETYGGVDILPTGNVLTSTNVDWVFPTNADHQYHTNIWEIDFKNKIPLWRVGFVGVNVNAPEDTTTAYPHLFHDAKNPDWSVPVGWNIYNVERVYPTISVDSMCFGTNEQSAFLEFVPYNTIRTQGDAPGIAVINLGDKIVSNKNFLFQKSWLPRKETMTFGISVLSEQGLILTLNNQWNNAISVPLVDIPRCEHLA